MQIVVLADTHDRLPPDVVESMRGADEIWHLGDVTQPWVIDTLKELGAPVLVVRGNCDEISDWPWELDLEREGFRIRLIHIPPKTAPDGIDLLFHGHTHVPRNDKIGKTRFYNPGCITRPNRGATASYARLTLTRGRPPRWELRKI